VMGWRDIITSENNSTLAMEQSIVLTVAAL